MYSLLPVFLLIDVVPIIVLNYAGYVSRNFVFQRSAVKLQTLYISFSFSFQVSTEFSMTYRAEGLTHLVT